jgi:hypothetical protein
MSLRADIYRQNADAARHRARQTSDQSIKSALEYPARLFAPVGEAEKGVGQRFEREGGRAVLSIYASENQDADTPASYLKKNLRQPALDYERVTRFFFAISMERDGTIFYSRCNFSARRSTIHCLDLVYPQSKKGLGPRGNTHELSLRPLNDKRRGAMIVVRVRTVQKTTRQ